MNAIPKYNPDRLVALKEAMRYGRWGRTKLYGLIHAGKVVAVRDHGITLVDLDSIDAYKQSLPRVE